MKITWADIAWAASRQFMGAMDRWSERLAVVGIAGGIAYIVWMVTR